MITFEPHNSKFEEVVLSWFKKPHVNEFYYGDGLQSTLNNIALTLSGRNNNGKYSFYHYVAFIDNVPFGFIMTSPITGPYDPNNEYLKHYRDDRNTFTMDLLIGNEKYLGKGLSYKMIQEFILNIYPEADYFLIDPERSNTKAVKSYQKASFVFQNEFVPDFNPRPHVMMRLDVSKLRNDKIKEFLQSSHITNPEVTEIVKTPWSFVLKILASRGDFYLKQTPKNLFIETKITKLIKEITPEAHVPGIVAESPDYNYILMKSVGDESLRSKFNGVIDNDLLAQGLHTYIDTQRKLELNIDNFLSIDVPDWRLECLPNLFQELISDEKFMGNEGVSASEITQLYALLPKIKSICEKVSAARIPETLVNADFNENNIIYCNKTGKLSLIDWGESVITHPFFKIADFVRCAARRYMLDETGEELTNLKQGCLAQWSSFASTEVLEQTYQYVEQLLPVFCSLALKRLQDATHNKSKTIQNWFIADNLRLLLNGNLQKY